MTPIEKNARKLVGVFVQHFPRGGICEDLRRQFEKDTSLRRQSFYNALNYCKKQEWLVGGGRDHRNQYQLYNLNPNNLSWKEPIPSIGDELEKDRLEHMVSMQTQQIGELQGKVERLLDWGGDDANGNVALVSLMKIVGDDAASTRQRIKASAAVLGYKVQDSDAVEFTKRFLQSVCTSTDIATDYRIEAGELLRKHEAPRIASETVKPSYSNDGTGAQRIEAWRVYERWQLKKQIVIETHEVPKPGWDNHLQRDTYAGPPEGSAPPPVRVVEDPVSGFRLLDNLMPKKPYRIGSRSDDNVASELPPEVE